VQFAIEARGRNFQRVVRSRYKVFDIEDRSKIAAESSTIIVRYSSQEIGVRSFGVFGFFREAGALFSVLFNEDTQGPVFGSAEELDFDHIEAVRSGHALRRGANLVYIERHFLR
jgi:hypothetical protein